MTTLSLPTLVALLAAAPSPRPAAPGKVRVAVLELRVVSADPAQAAVLSEVALTTAAGFGRAEVIGQSDINSLLGLERQKRLLGCADDSGCMVEIGGALGVDLLLSGSLGRFGALHRLDLKLIDVKKARVLDRFGETAEGSPDRLLEAVQRGVAALLAPVAGPAEPARAADATGARREAGARPAARAPARKVSFNGRPLQGAQWDTLARLEQQIGTLPDGEYWYDPRCGASGRWGGPTLAFLPPGLELGGPLPAAASGGGQGMLTGVFVNGRELNPVDVYGLRELLGEVWPGRYWVDAQGTYGVEGNPFPMGNLVVAAQARRGQGGKQAWSRRYEGATPRDNLNMASDGNTTCVSVAGYSRCTGE